MQGCDSLSLEPMAKQPRMLGLEDDWSGITSSATRRRVQNRLNQRAYRARKRNEKRACSGISKSSQQDLQDESCSGSNASSASAESLETETEDVSPITGAEALCLFYAAAEHRKIDLQKLRRVATVGKISVDEQQEAISEIKRRIESYGIMGSPANDHLLVLVKFNVFRAMMSNGKDLGYLGGQGMDDDDALSPFSEPSNSAMFLPVPSALQPTKLQKQIPHHPWIDTVPIAGMRDNLLRAGDSYDDAELCSDLVGFCGMPTGRTGMILWGEPWDPNAWEITEDFLRYWGWTVRGCKELVQATNFWREQRGEDPLEAGRVVVENVSD